MRLTRRLQVVTVDDLPLEAGALIAGFLCIRDLSEARLVSHFFNHCADVAASRFVSKSPYLNKMRHVMIEKSKEEITRLIKNCRLLKPTTAVSSNVIARLNAHLRNIDVPTDKLIVVDNDRKLYQLNGFVFYLSGRVCDRFIVLIPRFVFLKQRPSVNNN